MFLIRNNDINSKFEEHQKLIKMTKIIQKTFMLAIIVLTLASCAKKFMVIDYPKQQPPARELDKAPRVALVLGGGAFHGMAHVGAIKVLEDEGIPIDLIIGTSAGSMVGALYADTPHIDSLLPLVENTKAKDVFDFSLFRSREGFVSGKKLQNYLLEHMNVKSIEDTKIPFVAVTTDIERGVSVHLKAGPIAPSVNASCAIPGIFEPVKMYGTTFVDGGILDNIAVDVAKEYNASIIIAINIMALDTVVELKNSTDIYRRAFRVATNQLTEQRLKKASIVITPDLSGFPYLSSKDNTEMFNRGKQAAMKAMPQLLELMEKKGIKTNKQDK